MTSCSLYSGLVQGLSVGLIGVVEGAAICLITVYCSLCRTVDHGQNEVKRLWLRRHLLAAAARLAGGRPLDAPAPVAIGPLGRGGPHRLESGERGQCQRAGQKGGDKTGPNPTDRGKPGTKHHLLVDRQGIPLASLLTGANRHDSKVFEEVLDLVPPIRTPAGHRRKRPARLDADKAYDIPRCRHALTRRHIKVRIARKGIESSQRAGWSNAPSPGSIAIGGCESATSGGPTSIRRS